MFVIVSYAALQHQLFSLTNPQHIGCDVENQRVPDGLIFVQGSCDMM